MAGEEGKEEATKQNECRSLHLPPWVSQPLVTHCSLDQTDFLATDSSSLKTQISVQTLKTGIIYLPLKKKEKNRTTNDFPHPFFCSF